MVCIFVVCKHEGCQDTGESYMAPENLILSLLYINFYYDNTWDTLKKLSVVYLKFQLNRVSYIFSERRNLLPLPTLNFLCFSLCQNHTAEGFTFPCRLGHVHAMTPAPIGIEGATSPKTFCLNAKLTDGYLTSTILTFWVEGSLYSQPPPSL